MANAKRTATAKKKTTKATKTGEGTVLTARALNRATLARQMLLAREETGALAAIERLVGVQAQWPKPPYVALWSRVAGFRREDLGQLLAKRKVVRASMMRGTLHLASAKDYLRLRPSLQPVLSRGMTAILRDRLKGIDVDAIVSAARDFFGEEPRTFTELRDFLVKRYPKNDERAMGFAVRMLLPLVMVPTDADWGFPATADFALADAWLDASLDGADASPAALARRYLAACGPATVADIQAWSGFQGLAPVIESLRPTLVAFRDEAGKELFDVPDAPRPSEEEDAPPRLLPEFDNLVVSRSDTRFLAREHRSKVFLSALRVRATFLIDGRVAGTWSIARTKKKATLTLEPFATLPKKGGAARALEAESDALVRFVERDAESFEVRIAKG